MTFWITTESDLPKEDGFITGPMIGNAKVEAISLEEAVEIFKPQLSPGERMIKVELQKQAI